MELKSILANAKPEKVEVYYGIDGYTIPLVRRLQKQNSTIKQIVNGRMVAKFHSLTDSLVKEFISKRVEYGIEIKNLITENDKDLEIEVSNKTTLKETRFLEKEVEISSMISVFGDTVAITSLDTENIVGVIINDKAIKDTFESIFDNLWSKSTPI